MLRHAAAERYRVQRKVGYDGLRSPSWVVPGGLRENEIDRVMQRASRAIGCHSVSLPYHAAERVRHDYVRVTQRAGAHELLPIRLTGREWDDVCLSVRRHAASHAVLYEPQHNGGDTVKVS